MFREKLPRRPSEKEFTEAALRFTNDDYETVPICLFTGVGASVRTFKAGLANDEDIITREHEAAGLRGDQETLVEFAARQLADYQRLRNHH